MADLLVPVRCDALWLARAQRVVGPPADVERLPWFDGRRDRNGSVPHLASAIHAEPFAEQAAWLDAGVHLHWSLPDALTRGASRPDAVRTEQVDDLWFAPVPNRWYVALRLPQRDRDERIVRHWLVESDYVHPPGPVPPRAVAYALPDPAPGAPPYVHLGRQIELDLHHGLPRDNPALAPADATRSLAGLGLALTALGPGDPLFAAHYPSCRSVFGFHEEVPPDEAGEPRRYTVFGWYRDPSADPLARLLAALQADPAQALSLLARAAARAQAAREAARARGEPAGDEVEPPPHDASLLTAAQWQQAAGLALAERFGWHLDLAKVANAGLPELLTCLGTTTVATRAEAHPAPAPEKAIAGIGSSPAEALAAWLMDGDDAAFDAGQQDRLVHALAATDLSGHPLDRGLKLAEARHGEQFEARRGHAVWVIRAPETHAVPGDPPRQALPEAIAHELNLLNTLQAAYDQAHDRLTGLRQSLFDDWHHWMAAAYPEDDADPFGVDVDALQALIERTRLEPLEQLRRDAGQLYHGRTAAGGVTLTDRRPGAATADDTGPTLARRVVEQYRSLTGDLAALSSTQALTLGIAPGPRYWRPNDPVLVLADPVAAASLRHGSDGRGHPGGLLPSELRYLQRQPAPSGEFTAWPAGPSAGMASSLFGWEFGTARPAFATPADVENWQPVQLEWEVEFAPSAVFGSAGRRRYAPDVVLRHHHLPVASADLQPLPDLARTATAEFLSGRTILNPSAGRLLQTRLAGLPADLPLSPTARAAFTDQAPMVLTLGGFHDQLLLHRQEPQIGIDDPIGLPAQRSFTARVRQAMAGLHPASPADDGVFHPLRAGELSVSRLRVIDSFGRTKTWRPTRLLKTHRMLTDDRAVDRARLPLRLSQAARLDLRWLSATEGDLESTDHPATSPVCGWLLPDDLDGAVEVYARSGRLLGMVAGGGAWQPAPGDDAAPRHWREVEEAPLRRVVRWLSEAPVGVTPTDLVGAFVELLDTALEQIDPHDAAQHQARAMLVGRPLAVVRARLGLRLQHPGTPDPSLTALRARLAGSADTDHGLTAVRFPVRLGELAQADDGLCGYWIEDNDGFRDDRFHTPHGLPGQATDPRLRVVGEEALEDFPIQLTPDGPDTVVTMLIDPRGVVHAACGVLPVKSIGVPTEQYAAQAAALRATFVTAPVLTAADAVALPLPAEPGFAWSWLERGPAGWAEVPHHPTVERAALLAAFGSAGPGLWELLVARGRIVLPDGPDRGLVMPGDPVDLATALKPLALTPEAVERGLQALGQAIGDTDTRARFGARAIARDGWLQLRPSPVPYVAPPPDTPPPGGTH